MWVKPTAPQMSDLTASSKRMQTLFISACLNSGHDFALELIISSMQPIFSLCRDPIRCGGTRDAIVFAFSGVADSEIS